MDINKLFKLIKRSYQDSCVNSINYVTIKQGALQELCALIEKYTKIIFVTDMKTYKICGAKIINMLGDKLEKFLLYENQSTFESDEHSLEKLEFMIDDETDLIIGAGGETDLIIGAGGETVQSICKYESYQAKLPYYMIAVSPSSAKYIFPEAVLIKNHVRCVYPAHTPRAIIADTNIMKFIDYSKLKEDYEEMNVLFCETEEKLARNSNEIRYSEELIKILYNLKEMFNDIENGLKKQELKAVEKLMKTLLIFEVVNYDLKRIK